MAKPLTGISLRILQVMMQHPEGISEGAIREKLGISPSEQSNFGRRRRELHSHYRIRKRRVGVNVLYIYVGPLETPRDSRPINERLKSEILHLSRGRCGMCGRNIAEHSIALDIDHKIPREWGGATDAANLWAICEECNRGKKSYFKTADSELMKKVMGFDSVHVRLGETLKAFNGEPAPADILEFVANQNDWKKRIRDLRYLGWKVVSSRKRLPSGRVTSSYCLIEAKPWPENPSAMVQKYERDRAATNRKSNR